MREGAKNEVHVGKNSAARWLNISVFVGEKLSSNNFKNIIIMILLKKRNK
jgi:hypothetical protein